MMNAHVIVLLVVFTALGVLAGWLLGHWRAYQECCECCTCGDCTDVPRPGAKRAEADGDSAAVLLPSPPAAGPGHLDARPVDLERMFYDDAVSNDELRALDVPRPESTVRGSGPGHPTWQAQVAEYEAELARYLAAWEATVAWWAEEDPGWLTAYREAV